MLDWEAPARESYDRVAEPYAEFTREAVSGNAYMAGVYATLALRARGRPCVRRWLTLVWAWLVGAAPGWTRRRRYWRRPVSGHDRIRPSQRSRREVRGGFHSQRPPADCQRRRCLLLVGAASFSGRQHRHRTG